MRRSILFVVLSMLIAPVSFGSGSDGGDFDSAYEMGKTVFKKKLHCDDCPLAGEKLDKKTAGQLRKQILGGEEVGADLTKRDRKLVSHFLKKRYRL